MFDLTTILAFIFVLGVLVFVHELGHFLAAKLFGVRVERFSIGFPPRLAGVQIGETDYCISIIPLGGYVKLSGMIDESLDTSKMSEEPEPYEFRAKPTFQKIIIISAGVIMNFILAVSILGASFWLQGEPVEPTTTIGLVRKGSLAENIGLKKNDIILEMNEQPVENWADVRKGFMKGLGGNTPILVKRSKEKINLALNWDNLKLNEMERLGLFPHIPAKVGNLMDNYPAKNSGLQTGDVIIGIMDSSITGWYDMTAIISSHPGEELKFTVLRNGEQVTLNISPQADKVVRNDSTEQVIGRIGIQPFPYREFLKLDFSPAMMRGFEESMLLGQLHIRGFTRLITGKESAKESLAGPIEIAKAAGTIAKQSLSSLMRFIAMLSIVLAIINILPIPALDGGHLVMILIEGIIKKPIPINIKVAIQQIGMIFLLLLMVFVFYNDLTR